MFKGTFLDDSTIDFKEAIKSKDINVVKEYALQAVATRNPFIICDFAEFVPLADSEGIMPILEDGMIACGDIYHEYEFAFCMTDSGKKHFNLPRSEKRIRESGIAKIMYYTIECMAECDTEKMEKALIDAQDDRYIEMFKDNRELYHTYSDHWYESLIEKLKQRNVRYIPRQLIDIAPELDLIHDNQNDNILLDIVCDLRADEYNPMYINMCAEYTDCDKESSFLAMMNSDNILHIYEYYCSAACDDEKDEIFEYILNSGYAKIMYYMIAWTDLDLGRSRIMCDAIDRLNNKKYAEKAKEALAIKEELLA